MDLSNFPDHIQLVITKGDLLAFAAELLATPRTDTTSAGEKTQQRFTHKEAAAYLGIDIQTLYGMTSNRTIAYQKRGGKANFYLLADLDVWLLQNRKPSRAELADQADDFIIKNRRGGKEKGGKDGK